MTVPGRRRRGGRSEGAGAARRRSRRRPLVLAVSTASDHHCRRVMHALRGRARPVLVDLARFPSEMQLSLSYSGRERDFRLSLPGGVEVGADEVRAVWWRRPQPFVPDPAVRRPSHRDFAFRECHQAFSGYWQSLDARWVNRPPEEEAATFKPYQLALAQELGLDVPRTLVTNDPGSARAFLEERGPGGTIYKALQATETDWRETRLVREGERERLEAVRHAPVVFQEYVPAGEDLRVTAVGEELFTAAIRTAETAYPVDCRVDWKNARVEPARLPRPVEAGLRRYLRALGLLYAAVDLRRTPAGRHVFLEVNPSGQWLFVEERTGQPITRALADLLAAP